MPNGSPDIGRIKEQYVNYREESQFFIEKENSDFDFDFVVSDFVFEAFGSAKKHKVPSFGVAHFTWDWFFSKLYPPPVDTRVLQYMMGLAHDATKIFFPPFTPPEILAHYKANAVEIPLIVKKNIDHKVSNHTDKFKILVADSGAGVIAGSIAEALKKVRHLDEFVFFVAEKFRSDQKNLVYIPESDLMVDYINDMDLVIGRAGYNTISECIGLRTPMLLLGEAMNPEINENIILLKHHHLASFISMDTFTNSLDIFLPDFLRHEYKFIRQSMTGHEMPTNGAEVIAQRILEEVHEHVKN